ncbi:MAG: GHKL domain-containing protein [Syntrophomonadaceae bacterium]|nr:GHKL domain-containing protein [Syntrophomonadaceae bacterium]
MDHMNLLELIFISLPEAMLVAALGIALTGLKLRPGQLFIIGIFQALGSYVIRSLPVPFGLHTLIMLCLFVLIIYAATGLDLVTSALTGLSGLTVYSVVEMLMAPHLLRITGYTLKEALADPLLRIYYFVPEAAALLAIIALCRRFKLNILSYWRKNQFNSSFAVPASGSSEDEVLFMKQYFPVLVLVICPILLLALLNSAVFISTAGLLPGTYLQLFANFISIAVIVLMVLSVLVVKKITQAAEIQYMAKQTQQTLARMEELIYSIRKQRHDFNHHLQAVYGLLEVGSYQVARDYIRGTFATITTHGELIKTDNHEVSAMLYTKIGLAEAKNINLEVVVNCSLKNLPLNPGEANSVLGNLIDNAIDAVESAPAEKRLVTVEITRSDNDFIFVVANRGKTLKSEIADYIFLPDFSTKNGRRGLGLAIVKDLVNHYNGSLTVLPEDEETAFKIKIPAKKRG